MNILAFVAGAAVGAMFMGFCFSRSMNRFANILEKLANRIEMIERGMIERGWNG